MRRAATVVVALFLGGAGHWFVFGQPGTEDKQETPIGARWWPSEWGADDQRGAANRWTAQKLLAARDLIKTGKVYSLGRLYENGMPMPGNRHFSLTIPGRPTGGPGGKNQLVHNDELVSGEIGQVGTQFDGLGHVGIRVGTEDVFYNGNKLSEFGHTYGLKKLGIENVGPIFTRGVLLDVVDVKGERALPKGYVITVADLQKAQEKAKVKLLPGDAVLIHTGHGTWWMTDNKKYGDGEPGIGMAGARWLTEQKVSLIGADNWAVEVVPSEDPDRPFDVHPWVLTRHGIYLLENLNLAQLAADGVYEFAFVFVPLPLKGATGSPGNPIAIR